MNWINIKHELPPVNKDILVWCGINECFMAQYNDKGGYLLYYSDTGLNVTKHHQRLITHWSIYLLNQIIDYDTVYTFMLNNISNFNCFINSCHNNY